MTPRTTLPTTLQEWFDVAWNWAVVEKQPKAADDTGTCFYRGPEGVRCLIGAAIPDELYTAEIEDKHVGAALEMLGAWPDGDSGAREYRSGLYQLQDCHDQAAMPAVTDYANEVQRRLEAFADMFSLALPQPAV